jgi:hypothetical protein
MTAAFATGYAIGVVVSRERYEQMVRLAGRAGAHVPVSEVVTQLGHKAAAGSLLAVEVARDAVGSRLGWRDGDEAAEALAVEVAEDLALVINHHVRQPPPATHPTRAPAVPGAPPRGTANAAPGSGGGGSVRRGSRVQVATPSPTR